MKNGADCSTGVGSTARAGIIPAEVHMRTTCWILIALAALAFVVGTALAFTGGSFLLPPYGYWRGAVGLLLFAIALRMMEGG